MPTDRKMARAGIVQCQERVGQAGDEEIGHGGGHDVIVDLAEEQPQQRLPPHQAESHDPQPQQGAEGHQLAELRMASVRRLAPKNWLVTTAPPVASAANTLKIRLLIMSTSDTPEMAASPTLETMTVSDMPTSAASACSMTSGHSRRSSWAW